MATAKVKIFGVRHLSPGASAALIKLCGSFRPDAVLIEGPSNAAETAVHLTHPETVPPVAILAYTAEPPVLSFTLPFAVYSPELNVLRWAVENGAAIEFIDLPSDVFFGLMDEDDPGSGGEAPAPVKESPYERFAGASGEPDFDTSWEAIFEHMTEGYAEAAYAFGKGLRSIDELKLENHLRERYMRRCLRAAELKYKRILVVCGAYHAPALGAELPAMSDAELDELPRVKSLLTLMPYSYLRLSARTGYGAGNIAPLYFETLWNHRDDLDQVPVHFFSEMAEVMRVRGMFRSPAEVIEAVMLARTLGSLNRRPPVLADLRAAAITVLGRGEVSAVADALARTEIGTAVGTLPEGVGRTAVQDDFYRELTLLRLEHYRSAAARDISLDLRDDLRRKGDGLSDRRRSVFFHRLRVLGIPFAKARDSGQTKAGWKENWVLQWSPESDICLAEVSARGETLRAAAHHILMERLENSIRASVCAELLHEALVCDLPEFYGFVLLSLQVRAVDTEGFDDLVDAMDSLSRVLRYGSLRAADTSSARPLLEKLFLRVCLLLPENCKCSSREARSLCGKLHIIQQVYADHGTLAGNEYWPKALRETAVRDDLNPLLSGCACALLLENGRLSETELSAEISRRLSPAVPAELGAGWFEGLAGRNRYALLSRPALWKALDEYLQTLDEESFLRALVFLRRGFSVFSLQEKRMVFESLSAVWGMHRESAEDALSEELSEAELEALKMLDFSF